MVPCPQDPPASIARDDRDRFGMCPWIEALPVTAIGALEGALDRPTRK
jgi:hypothetical protein